MAKEQVQEKSGFDYLSDEDLAEIAKQKDDNGNMIYEAKIAFEELTRRDQA